MPIDWPTIIAFVVVEALFVLIAAPLIIQRRNEARAVAVFREHLLPLMPKPPAVPTVAELVEAMPPMPVVPTVDELVQAVVSALPAPSAEEQAAARAELVQGLASQVVPAVGPAVQAAIAEAVKGRMGALSAQGVEAKAAKHMAEAVLKAKVGEKYGLKGLGALKLMESMDKGLYQLGLDAVSYAPNSLDDWLEENAARFTLGGDGGAKSSKVRVL